MVVVTTPVPTVAVLLVRVTPKVSLPSTTESTVIGSWNVSSGAPTAKEVPPMLVAVTVTALVVGSVLLPLRLIPVDGTRFDSSRAVKSSPSIAVPLPLATVKVTLRPAARPTPFKATV